MGLFNWWNERKAKADVRRIASQRIAQLLEMQDDEVDDWQKLVERNLNGNLTRPLREDSNNNVIVNTRTEGMGWEILGSAYKGHVGADQQVMIAQARRFFRFDPNAQTSVFGVMEYLLGKGVTITPKSQDPRIWKLWRNFWTSPDNQMAIRQFEIVKRLLRDGETMLRYFTKDKAGTKTPFTLVRFIDPIDVRRGTKESNDNTDKTSQGIIFDENDAEKALAYFMRKRNNPAEEEKVDAVEVQHIKFPVADMDQPRGESALQCVMDMFTHYKQWLKNRMILNKLRTAIFAVREIDVASGANVSSLAQSLPASARDAGSGENKKQNIRPGTLYTPPPGVKLRMESANINASDVKEDGRNIKLEMAAGTRLPEYMFGDASNANFASTQMAESPFVKYIHFLQAYLEATLWQPMFRRVVQAAVDAGKLTPPKEEDIFAVDGEASGQDLTEDGQQKTDAEDASAEEDVTNGKAKAGKGKAPKKPAGDQPISESELELFYGCDVEWPEIIHRDPKEQSEALVLQRNEGWVSDKTASEKLGYDYGEEVRKQRQIEEEAEENGNPLLQHAQGDMQAYDEEGNAIDQQDKELAGAGGSGGGPKKPNPPFGKNGKQKPGSDE